MIRAIAIAWAVTVTTVAFAEPRVVIVERPDVALPGLAVKVGLHGRERITLTTIAAPADGSPVATHASDIVVSHDATLVVWVEVAPITTEHRRTYIVYVAGRWPDRALIELVRVDAATPASELERIIALKVVGLLDFVLVPRHTATALGVPSSSLLRVDQWRFGLGADAMMSTGDRGLAAGPALFVERRWRGDWDVSVHAAARMLLAGTISQDIGVVSIDELGMATGIEVARSSVFAHAGLSGSLLRATAAAADGRRGSVVVAVPSIEVGVGLRVPMSGSELVLMVGFDHALIQQRFLVDGAVIADLGRERAIARLAVSLPL